MILATILIFPLLITFLYLSYGRGLTVDIDEHYVLKSMDHDVFLYYAKNNLYHGYAEVIYDDVSNFQIFKDVIVGCTKEGSELVVKAPCSQGYFIIYQDDFYESSLSKSDFYNTMKKRFNIKSENILYEDKNNFKILKNHILIGFVKYPKEEMFIHEPKGYFIVDRNSKNVLTGLSKKEYLSILEKRYNIDKEPKLKYFLRNYDYLFGLKTK